LAVDGGCRFTAIWAYAIIARVLHIVYEFAIAFLFGLARSAIAVIVLLTSCLEIINTRHCVRNSVIANRARAALQAGRIAACKRHIEDVPEQIPIACS
jgi:hypothetical protein